MTLTSGRAGPAPCTSLCIRANCWPLPRSTSPADLLKIAFLYLINDVFRSAPGESHNCQCRVLVCQTDEGRAVSKKKVPAVPDLAVRIKDRCLRIVAHTRATNLMNSLSSCRDSPLFFGTSGRDHFSPHCLHNFLKGLLHVARHKDFLFTPLEVKLQDRNPPLVHGIFVDFTVAVFIGYHFSPPGEVDKCS